MAKCSRCDSRKGKRKCALTSGFVVCSQCCGEARSKPECQGCPFFRDDRVLRRYDRVPRFSVEEMEWDYDLPRYSDAMEGAICARDIYHDGRLTDDMALKVLEMLLDKYHFGDTEVPSADKRLLEGFEMVEEAIEKDLHELATDTIARVLGVIYFVAKRRSQGKRDYFHIIHRYVRLRADEPGIRVFLHLGQ